MKYAKVKWDGGRGALLCSRCLVIIKEGLEHEDKPHYCAKCNPNNGHNPSRRPHKGA